MRAAASTPAGHSAGSSSAVALGPRRRRVRGRLVGHGGGVRVGAKDASLVGDEGCGAREQPKEPRRDAVRCLVDIGGDDGQNGTGRQHVLGEEVVARRSPGDERGRADGLGRHARGLGGDPHPEQRADRDHEQHAHDPEHPEEGLLHRVLLFIVLPLEFRTRRMPVRGCQGDGGASDSASPPGALTSWGFRVGGHGRGARSAPASGLIWGTLRCGSRFGRSERRNRLPVQAGCVGGPRRVGACSVHGPGSPISWWGRCSWLPVAPGRRPQRRANPSLRRLLAPTPLSASGRLIRGPRPILGTRWPPRCSSPSDSGS